MGTAKERAAARYGRVERNRFTPYGALATASQELKSAYYYYGWPRDEDMPELPQPKWDAESQATPEELVNEKQTAELIVAMLAALRPQQAKVLQLRFGLCELANGMLAFLEQDMSKQFRLCLWQPGTVDITKTAVYLPPTTLSLQMLSAGDDMLITSDFAGTNHLIDVQHQIFKLLHCPSQDSHLLCNDCAKIGELVAFVESSQDIHFYQ